MMSLAVVFTIHSIFLASVEGQIFQCQTPSKDTYLFPEVAEFHFNATKIVSSDSYELLSEWVWFYKIPEYSISQRNCSGNVTSIRHCYWINEKKLDENLLVFNVVLGHYTSSSFTVTRLISINSTPTNDKCTVGGKQRVCCDNFEFYNNRFLFQLPEQEYMFGIYTTGHQVSITSLYYPTTSYRKGSVRVRNKAYSLGRIRSGPVMLIQFKIGLLF